MIERSGLRDLARYGGVGITLALGVAFFAWMGMLVDRRFGTAPWGLVILGLLGAVLSLYKFIRDVNEFDASGETPGPGA